MAMGITKTPLPHKAGDVQVGGDHVLVSHLRTARKDFNKVKLILVSLTFSFAKRGILKMLMEYRQPFVGPIDKVPPLRIIRGFLRYRL